MPVLKTFLSIFILSAIVLQLFSGSILFAAFKINQSFIAANLCENKSNPKMNCNGHCQLKKQLEEQEKKEQNLPPGGIKDKTELVYYIESSGKPVFALSKIRNTFFSYRVSAPVDFADSVFHPPSC